MKKYTNAFWIATIIFAFVVSSEANTIYGPYFWGKNLLTERGEFFAIENAWRDAQESQFAVDCSDFGGLLDYDFIRFMFTRNPVDNPPDPVETVHALIKAKCILPKGETESLEVD